MVWRPLDITDEQVEAFTKRFKNKAIFYLDESVGRAVAEILREAGYKVRTAAEYRLRGHDDTDHAALCWREKMILVTYDRDFLSERVVPHHRNPGVVVLDVNDSSVPDAAYRAAWFLAVIVGPFGRHWQHTKLVILANGECTVWVKNADTGAIEKGRYRLTRGPVEEWVEE